MPNPLDGARLKITRAREQVEGLDRERLAYLNTKPIQVENREELDGAKRHITWVATAATPQPPSLGLLVGDWAHNLRGALDYTVYELVRRETGDDDPRWTQFPIAVDAAKYPDQAKTRLRGAPAWSMPVFEGLQPFHDGDEAARHPLAILADVSNRDKHRLLHTAGMQIAGSKARLSGTSLTTIHGIGQNPGTVEDERVILEALLETDGDDFQIELDIKLDVALEGYEFPIAPLLLAITDEVEDIVDWFVPALA